MIVSCIHEKVRNNIKLMCVRVYVLFCPDCMSVMSMRNPWGEFDWRQKTPFYV